MPRAPLRPAQHVSGAFAREIWARIDRLAHISHVPLADRRIAERRGPKARTGRGGGTGTGLTWEGAPAGPDLARVAADARAVEREHLAVGREQPQEDKLLRCSRCVQLDVFELPAMHCALVGWSAARDCTCCILARSLSSRLTKQKLRARPRDHGHAPATYSC